jgi:hypothetical protein
VRPWIATSPLEIEAGYVHERTKDNHLGGVARTIALVSALPALGYDSEGEDS